MSKYVRAIDRLYKVVIDHKGNIDKTEIGILVEVTHHCAEKLDFKE